MHRAVTQTLHICQSCLPIKDASPPSDADLISLQEKLQAAGLDISVRSVDCLNVCNAPAALSLQAPKRASYVFSGVDIQSDSDDILATCIEHLKSDAGWITQAMACGRLRFCLVARIPSA